MSLERKSEIRSILISRMKFIGDVVLTTPVIRRVRQHYPDARIAYLCDANAAALLRGNPWLDEILPYDFSKPDLIEQPRMMVALRRRKFDAFIDLFSNPRTALLAYASGAAIRIGKDVPGRGSFYTHRIGDDGKRKTAIDFHFQYLEPIGIPHGTPGPDDYRTEIFLTEDEKREAGIFLKWKDLDPAVPIVGIHPGATWPAKKWEMEYFAGLIDLMVAKLKVQVVMTQGPNDAALVAEISKQAVANVTVIEQLPLRQLAGIISQCKVYVANDSGPMHISAAVGTKTLGIFGPGEEDIWFPYIPPYRESSAGHVVMRHDVPCHPCHLDFCNRTGDGFMECMKGLTVKAVFEKVSGMMR